MRRSLIFLKGNHMHTIRWTVSIAAFLATASALFAADPDFSGTWTLNRQRSEIRALPSAPAPTLKVEHQGVTIRATEASGVVVLTTDRKESRSKVGDATWSSVCKWEGDALLVNTIVNSRSGSYTRMDRWSLSRDGTTLTIRREVVQLHGSMQSTLVYERETPAGFAARDDGTKPAAPGPETAKGFTVDAGTNIPLTPLNTISTKHSLEGDRIYLTTVYPIISNGRVVIPPGSYVMGTVTQVKRPGRVKGRGVLFLRFDTLTLPNGVTRDFRARVGSMDGDSRGELDRKEGGIKSETDKTGDLQKVGEAASAGASVGIIAGGASGHYGMGAGIGLAAGAAAGVMGVLLSRGPDAVIPKGSTLEMKLDRTLTFEETELKFEGANIQVLPAPPQPAANERRGLPFPGRRW